MNSETTHYRIAWLLRLSAFIFLFSRGCLYVIFDSPYRGLLWNEEILRPFVELFGYSWRTYASSSNPGISLLENLIGLFLMISSVFFLTIRADKPARAQYFCLQLSGFFTCLHILLKYLGHNNEAPIIAEYILQGFTPWLFLAYLKYMPTHSDDKWTFPSGAILLWSKVIISLCFVGHGLYALGWPYQPASFVRMLSKTLFIDFETSSIIVTCVGLFDLTLAVVIFIKPFERMALGHMAFWGFVTAGARLMSYVIIPVNLSNLNPWLLESTVRFIHGALPLTLLLIMLHVETSKKAISLQELKNIFLRKRVIITVLSIMALATFLKVYHYSFQQELSENRKQNMVQAQKRYSSTKSPQKIFSAELTSSEFKKSAAGHWYSDEMFSNNSFPVRFILDTNANHAIEDAISDFSPYYKRRQTIIDNLKILVVENYKSNNATNNFTDKDILTFIKKTQLILDGENLSARVYAPWLETKFIDFTISEQGTVEN